MLDEAVVLTLHSMAGILRVLIYRNQDFTTEIVSGMFYFQLGRMRVQLLQTVRTWSRQGPGLNTH